ncbi:superoxide dismutase [Candidatus Woesearchaeota archaeon]|nr:superoxide dismutase [Candidatus Woesearchaeota archaeon]
MHTLPKLPYGYNALEPHIDELTMNIHHTKHHQAYIDKLNGAVKGTEFENMGVNELLKHISNVPENIKMAVRNHGGGHSNHSFFWEIMGPNAGGEPHGNVGDAIKHAFSSFDKFKEDFANAGLNRFGSGWAWLVLNNGELEVYSTANQDSPLMEGKTPILGVDVWEHAYYKKFGPARAEYIKEWWNVVNWKKVEKEYKKIIE